MTIFNYYYQNSVKVIFNAIKKYYHPKWLIVSSKFKPKGMMSSHVSSLAPFIFFKTRISKRAIKNNDAAPFRAGGKFKVTIFSTFWEKNALIS